MCTKCWVLDTCLGDRSDFRRKTNKMSPGDAARLWSKSEQLNLGLKCK
ncbi:hypothetical protein QOZ95_005478 [Paenibacillus brasilensis]|uniref:Uncharacterized protein n=1 Tax=Paenibacillus brasilensis TaxID=128574 RepID=A0ABU0L7K8_9BACL|nr:hypothetical protein [Paenibacillus brasilensis]